MLTKVPSAPPLLPTRLPVSRRRALRRERGLQRKGKRPILPGDLPSTPCHQFLQGAAQDDACPAPQGERLGQEERGQHRFLRWRRSPSSLSRLPQRFSSSKAQVRTPDTERRRICFPSSVVLQKRSNLRVSHPFSDSPCFLFFSSPGYADERGSGKGTAH